MTLFFLLPCDYEDAEISIFYERSDRFSFGAGASSSRLRLSAQRKRNVSRLATEEEELLDSPFFAVKVQGNGRCVFFFPSSLACSLENFFTAFPPLAFF